MFPFDVEVLTRTGQICTTLAYQINQSFCSKPTYKASDEGVTGVTVHKTSFLVQVIVQFSCEKMDGKMGITLIIKNVLSNKWTEVAMVFKSDIFGSDP